MTQAKLECGCIVEKGRIIRHCRTSNCKSDEYRQMWRKYKREEL